MRLIYLIIILSMFILVSSELIIAEDVDEAELEFEDDDGWEFHCALGVIGIVLVLFVLSSGFLISGRFGRIQNLKPLPIHKYSTLIMALFFTGESVYGFFMLGWFFIANFHGYLGLFIPIVAWLTVGFSPCIAKKFIKWKYASRIHAVLAIILLLLILLQVLYAYAFLET